MEKMLILGDVAVKISDLKRENQSWKDILEAYLDDFMGTTKAKYYWKVQVQRQIRTIKKWLLAQNIIFYGDLTREKARAYAEWRGNRSASTLNKELLRIRAVIRFAEKFLGLSPNFAFEGINVCETMENTRFVEPFSIAECRKILKWVRRKPYFHDMILLMLLTGMENKALTLMTKDWWHIKEKMLFVFPRKVSGVIDAKNQHRARKIPINQTMLNIYNRGYIFKENCKERSFNRRCQKLFKRCTAETGIQGVHCHRFRHTFASQILSAGYDVVRVSKLLGHKNINVTLKHYADFILNESDGGFEGMVRIHKDWIRYLNEKYFK